MLTITRLFEWDAAHRLPDHEGQCRALHGHRYKAEITIQAPETDEMGRIVDFGLVKLSIGKWIDRYWDHTTIVKKSDDDLWDFCRRQSESLGVKPPYPMKEAPTAEAMAQHLAAICQEIVNRSAILDHVKSSLVVIKVVLYETPNCWATYELPLD